jgi:hypothetical protein
VYLEIIPVLLVAAAFGFIGGVIAAVAIGVPASVLEYNGAFHRGASTLPASTIIQVAIMTIVVFFFTRFLHTAELERALAERRRIDIGMRTLSEAGAAMFASLDYTETLNNVADAITATFATSCTIEMIDSDGIFRRVAISDRREAARELYPPLDEHRLAPNHPIVIAIRRGESTCVTSIDSEGEDLLPATMLAALAKRNVRSFLTVPARAANGAVIGSLSCSIDRDDARPAYIAEDVPFAEELGRRAGVAIGNARAYERERSIAVRFQQASLPQVLPELAEVRLDAEYRPGESDATVGGDWYDAFLLDDGRVAITIGDVLGKGLDAAVTMAQVRQAMRAAAPLSPRPNAMLDVAETTLRDVSPDMYATAIAAIYDPSAQTLTYASAGHAGPMIRLPDGTILDATLKGSMLGIGGTHATGTNLAVTRGSAIVFFTDGLTELLHDLDDGYTRVFAAMSDDGVLRDTQPARALVTHVLDDLPARDDIAVLVVQVR